VTTALRGELARRGADAGEGAPAVLDGEVRASDPVLTSTSGATWRIGIEVRARLTAGQERPLERTIRRETDFLGVPAAAPTSGSSMPGDPLETEGRRALALRRLADEVARDVLRSLER
jgi:hypothetical protein